MSAPNEANGRVVVVAGGTGFVGRRIALAAADAGYAVRVMARDAAGARAALSDARIEIVEGAILEGDGLDRALRGVDALVHAAATYSYERRDAHRMIEENPRLTERVFAAARAAGVTHAVDVSSAIVFRSRRADARPGQTDAASPLWHAGDAEWADPYLRSKVLAEHVARRYAAAGLPMTSLHPVNTIGPGDRVPGVSGAILVQILRNGALLPHARSAWVDVRDVAAAAVAVLARPPGGRHVLAVVSESWPATAARLDRLTGRRRRRVWLPARAVRVAARLNERLGGRLAPDLPPPGSLEFILTLGQVDGRSGLPALGLEYRPFESTLRETLDWWVANGVLPPDSAVAGAT
jgi:dihydroflavonol-4-reductase